MNSFLPVTSVPEKEGRSGLSLPSGFYVLTWMFFSNITILFNKWLIDDAGFRFPVLLTVWHMVFATLATQVLARTTSWLDGRHQVRMSKQFYLRAVVPIGLLYSASMVCSNLVYMYLNVAFIQMLKAASPFTTLVVSWLWGQEKPSKTTVCKILIIVFGVLLASFGEIHFSALGFLYSLGGLVFESLRVVMVKNLISGGDGGKNHMDPLVSLYYYAPVCALVNFIVAYAAERHEFSWSAVSNVGLGLLSANALVAFFLNVASVMLANREDLCIGPPPLRCPQKYPPGRRIGTDMGDCHHPTAGIWLQRRPGRDGLVQAHMGGNQERIRCQDAVVQKRTKVGKF
ncbi:hypothetical protein KJ359_001622 [Pestalotiopsis sp. 9143b]|nr:hypothetical protein KJ359_001622 [Pestalotiopsis sp. 9143b]